MRLVDAPQKFFIPFAHRAGMGFVRAIPQQSQIGLEDGAASFADGFPPLNFIPLGSGGVPPFGQDFNGLFYQVTQWLRMKQAGWPIYFDKAFCESIGGYPKGAFVQSNKELGAFWISVIDENFEDPDFNLPSAPLYWVRFPHMGWTIPYGVDTSPTPGLVQVELGFTEPARAGDLIAVKIANTNEGPTTIEIDNLAGKKMLPNGGNGSDALWGDVHKGDVVIMLHDGESWWFTPNPEITGPAHYSVGCDDNVKTDFETVAAAMEAIKRKIIGARGSVTLTLIIGNFDPISVSHPNADRIIVEGTMRGNPPKEVDFWRSGNNAQSRALDASANITMLRNKFGTIIRTGDSGQGAITNTGPGSPLFRNFLVVGNQLSWEGVYERSQYGIIVPYGSSVRAENISIWGAQLAVIDSGGCNYKSVFVTAAVRRGFSISGGGSSYTNCHVFGGGGTTVELPDGTHYIEAWFCESGQMYCDWCSAQSNSSHGWCARGGAGVALSYSKSFSNGQTDLSATGNATIMCIHGANDLWYKYDVLSPAPVNTSGNMGALIFKQEYFPPPAVNPYL